MPKRSSHPLLSYTDELATSLTDTLLLIGRILIAALFLLTVWFGNPTTAYLTSINYISPKLISYWPTPQNGSLLSRWCLGLVPIRRLARTCLRDYRNGDRTSLLGLSAGATGAIRIWYKISRCRRLHIIVCYWCWTFQHRQQIIFLAECLGEAGQLSKQNILFAHIDTATANL